MIFTSSVFLLLFLPLCVLLGRLTQKKYRKRTLLILSVLFYCWCGIRFFLLLFFLATFAYGIGRLIERADRIQIRRLFLAAGMLCTLGALAYHKYFYDIANMFIKCVNAISKNEVTFAIEPIILPLGISFYTFSILSFFLDIYWEKCSVPKKITDFYLYIFFFPKLIQGPILQYADFNSQIEDPKSVQDSLNTGLELFIKGIVKKVMIADQLVPLVNYSFENIAGGGV